MVGNAATDWEVDVYPSMMEMAYQHNVIDEDLYKDWRDNDCKMYFREVLPTDFKEDCSYVVEQFFKNMEKINIYDVYRSPYIGTRTPAKGINDQLQEYD